MQYFDNGRIRRGGPTCLPWPTRFGVPAYMLASPANVYGVINLCHRNDFSVNQFYSKRLPPRLTTAARTNTGGRLRIASTISSAITKPRETHGVGDAVTRTGNSAGRWGHGDTVTGSRVTVSPNLCFSSPGKLLKQIPLRELLAGLTQHNGFLPF